MIHNEQQRADKAPEVVQIKHWRGHVLFECEVPADVESGMAMRYALEKAVTDRRDLRGAVLRGAVLRGAVLRGAVLSDADLRGADLSDADLRGADLSDADLSGADLSDADLRGADLSDADLRDESGAPLRATPEEAIANLDKVREIILDNHERLEMGHWHGDDDWRNRTCAEEVLCGTTHCLAGWLQVCSTKPEIRELDAQLAGVMAAPVAAKMFFRGSAEALEWLKTRAYVAETEEAERRAAARAARKAAAGGAA